MTRQEQRHHELSRNKSFVPCSNPKPCLMCVENDDPPLTIREWMALAWNEGYRAGWDDRHEDEYDPLPAGEQHDTPNPYKEAP